MSAKLNVDPEFQSLIPPLTDDEFQRLEKSILAEGVRDPIITWGGTIIDGHNRYRVCTEHGVEFRTAEREFASREAAKIWIIENQFGRRNLSKYDRSVLALQLEEMYAAEAKAKQRRSGGAVPKKSAEPPMETRERLAKVAGVSHDTLRKVKVIETEAAKGNETAIEARDAIKSGSKSIHGAYSRVTKAKKKLTHTEDGRRICTICGKPIDDGDAYDGHLSRHKSCYNARNRDSYLFPDKSLLENVPTYTTDSLKAELLASAKQMKAAMKESIAINESMGVSLTDKQKKNLEATIAHVIRAINKI